MTIEAGLLESGALGGDLTHQVLGLLVGAFRELFPAFFELANAIAQVRALKHLSHFSCEQASCAFGVSRLSGVGCDSSLTVLAHSLTAQRHLRTVTLPIMMTPTEHRNLCNPDHGQTTANGSGLGWRGGGACVSAVRYLFFLSCCRFCLHHTPATSPRSLGCSKL